MNPKSSTGRQASGAAMELAINDGSEVLGTGYTGDLLLSRLLNFLRTTIIRVQMGWRAVASNCF